MLTLNDKIALGLNTPQSTETPHDRAVKSLKEHVVALRQGLEALDFGDANNVSKLHAVMTAKITEPGVDKGAVILAACEAIIPAFVAALRNR